MILCKDVYKFRTIKTKLEILFSLSKKVTNYRVKTFAAAASQIVISHFTQLLRFHIVKICRLSNRIMYFIHLYSYMIYNNVNNSNIIRINIDAYIDIHIRYTYNHIYYYNYTYYSYHTYYYQLPTFPDACKR